MKIVVIPNDTKLDKYLKIGADAFIFGLTNYSCGFKQTLTLEEIKEIRKTYKGELFISMNNNFFNEELIEVEKMLIELDKLNITGVLFYDLALINIKKRLNLSIDLVWNQTHMVTNYNTCNYYLNMGIKYGVISSEITLEEILETEKNTKMKLFVNILGYQSMAFSRRKLLSNYFENFNEEMKNDEYVITNLKKDYIIREEEKGTNILFGEVLNGSNVVNKLNVEYIILNEDDIEEKFLELLDLFKKLIDTKDESYSLKIDSIIGENRGFFNKKTIYRVKK